MKWPFKKTPTRDPVLDALRAEGDSGHIPRNSIFYFYGGDLAGLENTAIAAGYLVGGIEDGIMLQKVQSVDEEAFAPIHLQMSAWANTFSSDYDGWECELVTN
jgi:hypothetical protein